MRLFGQNVKKRLSAASQLERGVLWLGKRVSNGNFAFRWVHVLSWTSTSDQFAYSCIEGL